MTRNFFITVVICVIALGIFVYFIFGFNGNLQQTSAAPTPAKTSDGSASKLQIHDEKIGTGEAVKKGDMVVINYTGTLQDGTKFDSSYDRGQPFETKIGVGQVIKGWDEGVIGMKVGGKRKLVIPPQLGYGDQAVGPIPANSTLIFDVELVGIK